jgi:hypothetical protein
MRLPATLLITNSVDRANMPENTYHLDEDRRDILLVHSRQDVAHALSNTISLLKAIHTLTLLTLVLVALLFAVALRLWQVI